jgi:hypothetical protein
MKVKASCLDMNSISDVEERLSDGRQLKAIATGKVNAKQLAKTALRLVRKNDDYAKDAR